MRFNVSSKALYSFVSAVNKVISSKNALTILNNFLFSLKGSVLTVTACDLENSLVGHLNVIDAEGEGKFCIDAKRLVDLLKEMPEQGVVFEINDENLAVTISYESGHYNLIAINGDEYPFNPEENQAEDGEDTIRFRAEAAELLSGIDSTLFAVGSDDLRPQMMGILCDLHENDITFVATDTRKLVKFVNSNIHPGATGRFILPVKPATVLKNVFTKEGAIEIVYTPKNVTFTSEAYTFTCCLIKGNFPDYNRVIPANSAFQAEVDRKLFATAVRRISVFVEGGNRLVKFKFTPEHVELRASDTGICANARESLPCSFNGTQIVMGFSAEYLLEIFNTFTSTDVVIKLSDPSKPGVFVPAEDREGTELVMLLMPMTVTDFDD